MHKKREIFKLHSAEQGSVDILKAAKRYPPFVYGLCERLKFIAFNGKVVAEKREQKRFFFFVMNLPINMSTRTSLCCETQK